MTTPQHAPAGWYPDPSGGGQRYWDGSAWLDLVPPPPLEVTPHLPEPMPKPPPPNEPTDVRAKTTVNAKCFNCNHTQAVPTGVLSYACEQCGTKLKRHPRSKGAPAQLDTASSPKDSDDEEPDTDDEEPENPDWLRIGVPSGLFVLAVVFIIIGIRFQASAFIIPALVSFLLGMFWLGKTRSPTLAPVALSTTPQPDEVRQHQLEEYLSQYLTITRGRIESVTPFSAVVVTGEEVNHILHLLISIFLCGLWLPVWLVVALSGGEKRTVISVDHCGNVTTSR